MTAGGRRIVAIGAAVAAAAAIATLLWWLRAPPRASPMPPTFAGSAACAACHAAEHAGWAGSQHALAMQEASEATVLGRFDGADFTDARVTSRFFRRDGRFFVRTDGPDGGLADFEVKYTFGIYPLQQYLVPLPGGRLQALGVAWDSRPEAAGGQRWFHLYPGEDLRPGDPLHWTGIDQNWNYQCADCHSTNLRKNYDPAAGTFATTWSEISVGCEACHGPASNHLAWARRGEGWRALAASKGLVNALDERRGVSWKPAATGTAARSVPRAGSREIDTCARCHARRGQFDDAIHAGQNWLDGFRPALLEPGLYYPDGQQRDEVYTWGSFLQSRMHAAGVTCADCHEPHTQKLREPGNGVCAQCHAVNVFDTPAHHRHAPDSPGSRCAACHMPTTTYMVVDPRHDHSLRIPRPDLSTTLSVPNACDRCHADRGPAWAGETIEGWYPQRKPGFQSFAAAFSAAERREPAAQETLRSLLTDPAQPAIVRASAIARLRFDPGASGPEPVAQSLADPSALVRAAAAESLAAADAALRAERLAPLLTDPVRLVRMDAARALAGEPEARLLGDERARFAQALNEWLAAQRFNADRPEAQLNLGALELQRGATAAAIAALQKALELDPTFAEAAVNLADAYRATGDEPAAARTLQEALKHSPRAAVLHHVLGLTLIRQGKAQDGVTALGVAHELAPGDARFAYVYAVGLHDTGQKARAIALLRASLRSHPGDRDLRDALDAYEQTAMPDPTGVGP